MKFLVFIEQRDGKIRKASLEALSLARKPRRRPRGGGHPGQGRRGAREGSRQVRRRDGLRRGPRRPRALFSNKGYVGALDAAAKKCSPDAVLIAATAMGKDVAPRFAARHDVSVARGRHGSARRGRPARGVAPGLLGQGPRRGRLRRGEAADRDDAAERLPGGGRRRCGGSRPSRALELGDVAPRARVVRVETSESRELDVAEADVIVSGGRGHQGAGELARDPRPAAGSRRGARRLAGRRRRGLDRPPAPGRPDRQGRLADALRRLRDLRRDPASGRHGDVEGHRRDQQGPRGADLQGRDLRRRRRHLPDRSGVREGRPGGSSTNDGGTRSGPPKSPS